MGHSLLQYNQFLDKYRLTVLSSFLHQSLPPTDLERKYLPPTFSWVISIRVHSQIFGRSFLVIAVRGLTCISLPRLVCIRKVIGEWKWSPMLTMVELSLCLHKDPLKDQWILLGADILLV